MIALSTTITDAGIKQSYSWGEFFFGVFTGLTVSGLIFLLKITFDRVILPLRQNSVYSGIRIDGDWSCEQDDKPVDGEGFLVKNGTWRVTLNQKAHIVSGEARVTRSSTNGNLVVEVFKYDVTGHIYDRYVSLTMRGKNKKRIAHSNFLLELKKGGAELVGYRNFYGKEMDAIRSIRCWWKQDGAEDCDSETSENTLGQTS